MATLTGRITIVAADVNEYNTLLGQVAALSADYTLVSKDDPSVTIVVDVNAQA